MDIDYRERFINELSTNLVKQYDTDEVRNIMSMVIVALDKYEMSERTTEVALADNTSEELLELYAGTLLTSGKSKKTVYSYIRFLQRFKRITEKPFVKITTMDIRIWLARRQKEVDLSTCDNDRAYLSAFYEWLFKEKIITYNPMLPIGTIKVPKKIKEEFSDVQLELIRKTCSTLRDRAVIEIFICSGIRVSELSALNINDINFQEKNFIVREAKGGKQRKAYLNDIALFYLKKYLASRSDELEYLFVTKKGNRMSKDCIESMIRTIGNKVDIEKCHPHRFRRTFATNMYKRGMDIHTIQRLLGHADINATMKYICTNNDMTNYEYRKYA